MQNKLVRIGILSTANIATRSVIPSIMLLPEQFHLVGIASRDINKAKGIADQYGIFAFGSYETLLKSNLIDAIYVALPNSLHFYWVKRALDMGIHVLVEKSMGCNLNEVIELNTLAKLRGLSLIENFQFRFHHQLNEIREYITSGIIGKVNYIRSSFEFPPFPDNSNIRYQKELGGGALLDAGAYPIKVSQILLGLNISFSAAVLKYGNSHEVNIGGGGFIVQNDGDIFSEISFGFNNFYQCSLEVFGESGIIKTDRIFTAPPNFKPTVNVYSHSNSITSYTLDGDNAFVNMLKYFYNTVFEEDLRHTEYNENVNQSRLLNEFNFLAHAK